MGAVPVKYELDKASGAMFVDRFLHTAMHYPTNYGFVPHTLSEDGDPCDVMVVGNVPIVPGAVVCSRPIGVLFMEDEAGQDEKIIAVPADDLRPLFKAVASYRELPEILRDQIEHFLRSLQGPGKRTSGSRSTAGAKRPRRWSSSSSRSSARRQVVE